MKFHSHIIYGFILALTGLLPITSFGAEKSGIQSVLSINAKIGYRLFSIDGASQPWLKWSVSKDDGNEINSTLMVKASSEKTNDSPDKSKQESISYEPPLNSLSAVSKTSYNNDAKAFLTPDMADELSGYVGLKVESGSALHTEELASSISTGKAQWKQSFTIAPQTRVVFDVDGRAGLFVKCYDSKENANLSANANIEFAVSQGDDPWKDNVLAPRSGQKTKIDLSTSDIGTEDVTSRFKVIIVNGTIENKSNNEVNGSVLFSITGNTSASSIKFLKNTSIKQTR